MNVLIAGGGTGGHLFPGIALAEELKARGAAVTFVGTERGIEVRAVPKAGFPLELVRVSGLKRVGATQAVRSLAQLPASFFQCVSLLRRLQPDVVVGVGGYASGPVVMTAALLGIPTAILEQNSIPGMTNKLLGKVVRRVFGSFETAARYFPARRYQRLGNPVRKSLLEQGSSTGTGVLVLGGSQGAHALNEVVPAALAHAFRGVPAVPVLHQSGDKDLELVKQAYHASGVSADVKAFVDDMGAAYRGALLCVCRAGATTCAELTALGKPAVLIPLPTAADDHQTHNARELQDAGAAVLVAQAGASAEILGNQIAQLLKDPPRLAAMARASSSLGRPRAAQDIADALPSRRGATREEVQA